VASSTTKSGRHDLAEILLIYVIINKAKVLLPQAKVTLIHFGYAVYAL
jgi:hypothetical protein